MPDREKVIKGLEEITNDKWMKIHADWYVSICSDALALLKEQEVEIEKGKTMADIEKVIKGLKCCEDRIQCENCPYGKPRYIGIQGCTRELASDALALLKKQQEEIDFLTVESGSNAELAEGYAELMQEQKEQFDTLKENFAHLSAMIAVQQEIVRCKDCKYWSDERINDFNKCKRWINVGVKNFATIGDWFCADGERK